MTTPFSRVYWENQATTAWTNLGNPPPTQGDPGFDAFRHAFTSATWTRYLGENIARAGGDYIEQSNSRNFNSGSLGERDMRGDLLNNAFGREIGKQAHPGWTQDTLAREIYDALGRGELVTSPQTDPRTETLNFPPDLNPTRDPSLPSNWDLEGWNFFSAVDSTVNTDFTTAQNWRPARDPLVLDLNGGGISTVGINPSAPILFDHDGDGIKTGTGWVGAAEGMLMLDINANGNIDSGRELFGDNTLLPSGQLAANGFAALAQYDSNADGRINSQDAIYTQLKIWQDANQDGVSQTSELSTLAQQGVSSINLTATQTNTNLGGGNTQTWTGSFVRVDGTTGVAGARVQRRVCRRVQRKNYENDSCLRSEYAGKVSKWYSDQRCISDAGAFAAAVEVALLATRSEPSNRKLGNVVQTNGATSL
jgi:hypothetical protein